MHVYIYQLVGEYATCKRLNNMMFILYRKKTHDSAAFKKRFLAVIDYFLDEIDKITVLRVTWQALRYLCRGSLNEVE